MRILLVERIQAYCTPKCPRCQKDQSVHTLMVCSKSSSGAVNGSFTQAANTEGYFRDRSRKGPSKHMGHKQNLGYVYCN